MNVIELPNEPSVRNASANANALAIMLRDGANSAIHGRQSSARMACSMCNRRPPSGKLFEIVVDTIRDEGVRLGIGRCHRIYLGAAVRRLIQRELQGNHPEKEERIRRLREVLRQLT
jgi:hypothetical protein